jgi:hypothetical protein
VPVSKSVLIADCAAGPVKPVSFGRVTGLEAVGAAEPSDGVFVLSVASVVSVAAPVGNGRDAAVIATLPVTPTVPIAAAPAARAIAGAVPMLNVGVAANAGNVPLMPNAVFVIDPIAAVPADNAGKLAIETGCVA